MQPINNKNSFKKNIDWRMVCVKLMFLLYVVLLVVLGAKYENLIINYSPINGDLQNFNGYRRLLDGQVPFKDFVYYLGFGPLYINSILLSFFEPTFYSSIVLTNVLSELYTITLFAFVLFLITKRKDVSLILSVFSTMFLYDYIPVDIINDSGNSFRGGRLFIVSLGALCLYYFYEKLFPEDAFVRFKNISISALFASFLFLWSTDYGVASLVSFSILWWFIQLRRCLDDSSLGFLCLVRSTCFYIALTLLFVVILISVSTQGYLVEYINFIVGNANYQYWYYGVNPADKITEWIGIVRYLNWKHYFILLFVVFNLCKIIKCSNYYKEKKEWCVLTFIFLSITLCAFLYSFGSGSNSLWLILDIVFFFSLVGVAWRVLEYIALPYIPEKIKSNLTVICCVLLSIIIVSIFLSKKEKYATRQNNLKAHSGYDKILGGYLSPHLNKMVSDIQDYLDGEKVFSTYAGVYEIKNNFYQPSSSDYIIHVLGDRARNDYLNKWVEAKYKYALTINQDFSHWEGWIERANWFFYRHLFMNYSYEETIGYNDIYINKPPRKISSDTRVEVIELDGGDVKIIINAQDKIRAIADLKIAYHLRKEDVAITKRLGGMRSLVSVNNTHAKKYNPYASSFNIPSKSDEYYIPVDVIDGYGEVILESRPKNNYRINVVDLSVENLLVPRYHNDDFRVFNLTDSNWTSGIHSSRKILLLKSAGLIGDSPIQGSDLDVQIDGKLVEVTKVSMHGIWLHVHLDKEVDEGVVSSAKILIHRK